MTAGPHPTPTPPPPRRSSTDPASRPAPSAASALLRLNPRGLPPDRPLLLLLVLATTAVAAIAFANSLGQGSPRLEFVLWVLFTLLSTNLAMGFWLAIDGLLDLCQGAPPPLPPPRLSTKGRTAVLIPVYNEDPISVFAGVEAMAKSLARCGVTDQVHLHVLSDSVDPAVWLQEEMAFGVARGRCAPISVGYTHRVRNTERKPGNIADFVTTWGGAYEHLIILDADSVMSGHAILELVRRLDVDEDVALIQTGPRPVGRLSPFARLQQFASAAYGPHFSRGLARFHLDESSSFGHNQVVRTRAFAATCGLAPLPGAAPLGGVILSHDFVEAALLRRDGWQCRFADDIQESWEECPTTLLDYAQRDRRWCQGNLQHLQVIPQPGLHWVSRLHLSLGVFGYLSGPLWLLFMLLALLHGWVAEGRWSPLHTTAGLTTAIIVALLILLPKILAVSFAILRAPSRRSLGGGLAVAGGAVLETFVSSLIAPIMMLYHSIFVVSTLAGWTVTWKTQNREDRLPPWSELLREHAKHQILGICMLGGAWAVSPMALAWMSPVWGGLLLAPLIARLVADPRLGAWLAHYHLLAIPEEFKQPRELAEKQALKDAAVYDCPVPEGHPLTALLADPGLRRLHRIVESTGRRGEARPADPELIERVVRNGHQDLKRDEIRALMNDPDALDQLAEQRSATN